MATLNREAARHARWSAKPLTDRAARLRTVPSSGWRHASISRREGSDAQTVASLTFLVIALRWIALRGTPTGEKVTCGLMPPVVELSPKSHSTITEPGESVTDLR